MKKKVKEPTIKEWKAMVNANNADKNFVPLAKKLTPEKIKELTKLVKGGK